MMTVPLAVARAQLSKLVDDAVRTHERVEVTRNGRRAAVILSADDYDSLMETLDILGDAEAMAEIRRADRDIAAGRTSTLAEVAAEMRALGRLPG
ncbi:MAG: type II toxin-antitoxin system Phd/YefM family antitoxin [Dermatophilaceae bacterium]